MKGKGGNVLGAPARLGGLNRMSAPSRRHRHTQRRVKGQAARGQWYQSLCQPSSSSSSSSSSRGCLRRWSARMRLGLTCPLSRVCVGDQ